MLAHQREEVQMQSEAVQKELDVLLTQKRLKEELETEAKVRDYVAHQVLCSAHHSARGWVVTGAAAGSVVRDRCS